MNLNFCELLDWDYLMNVNCKLTHEAFGLEFNKSRFLNLEELLPWFENEYKVHELINEFWGITCKSRLIAVTRDIQDKAWQGLVAEWDTGTNIAGQFRVNKTFIERVLKNSLGDNGKPFKLKQITPLELSVFENFFVELENFWNDYWRLSIPNSNGNFIYLIWGIEIDDKDLGSIAIGVPPGLVPSNLKIKAAYDLRSTLANLDIEVPLDLDVGKSKLKISEIRGLEEDDLIVFENSDIRHLIWNKSELDQLLFNVGLPAKDNPNYRDLYYDLDVNSMNREENHSEDLLTDLPVELTAKFKSVQMPLSKILELESGGILPLGLLIDSQLTLVAPGDKPIASGNLVIVGNQFGIKISKTNIKKAVGAKLSSGDTRMQPPSLSGRESLGTREAFQEQEETGSFLNSRSNNFNSFDEDSDDSLDRELEDIGIDPKELDELEDLY
jgi:flagellar motor switch/type III secretory pathway protein FliN